MATHVIPTVADARAAANVWLLDHLPLVQMKMQALALYDQHRAAIDAPLS